MAIARNSWADERARGNYWVNDPAYGAVGDGVTDDSSAIDAAIAAAGENTGSVVFPAGEFNIGTGLTAIAKNSVHLIGAGRHVTKLIFTPTGDGDIAIDIDKGASTSFYCSIKTLTLKTTDDLYNKTAIRISDSSSAVIEDVHVEDFDGAGTDSVGIHLLGRELLQLNRIKVDANVPIRLSGNPNADIDVDEFSFKDIYLISADTTDTLTRACILADGDVIFKRLSISGANAFVKGDYGFYYVTNGLVGTSQRGIRIQGFHTEQLGAGAWSIYIDDTAGGNYRYIRNLSLSDGHLQDSVNGIYIRGIEHVSLNQMHLAMDTGTTILDIDGGSDKTLSMNWTGVFTLPTANNPGTLTTTNLALIQQFTDENDTHPHTATWSGTNGAKGVFSDGDATPSVGDSYKFYMTANTNPTTITDFDDGYIGQEIFVKIDDANTTIDMSSNANITGNGGADLSTQNSILHCICDDALRWVVMSIETGV